MTKGRILLLFLALVVLLGPGVLAQVQTESQTPKPMIVVFYEDGCPNCIRMEGLLDNLLTDHDDVTVVRYEINAPGSTALLWKLSAHYGIVTTQVPVIFVGDKAIVGAGRTQEITLRTAIGDCISQGCPSPLEYAEGGWRVLRDLLTIGAFVGLFVALLLFQSGL
jgi:glutaredoxin